MQGFDQLKDAMAGLRRRKEAMVEQMQAFKALQDEIAALRTRAGHDANARKKLQRLDELMKNGGQSLADRLANQAGKTERYLKQISEDFAQIAAGGAQNLAGSREKRAMKKFNRPFV